jgi:hypothetical protein
MSWIGPRCEVVRWKRIRVRRGAVVVGRASRSTREKVKEDAVEGRCRMRRPSALPVRIPYAGVCRDRSKTALPKDGRSGQSAAEK